MATGTVKDDAVGQSRSTDELERICNEVMAEYGMSFGGVYVDFAKDVARRAAILEREECAKLCDGWEADRWALYKGQKPFCGTENGRADPVVMGEADGAGNCAARIRARSNEQN